MEGFYVSPYLRYASTNTNYTSVEPLGYGKALGSMYAEGIGIGYKWIKQSGFTCDYYILGLQGGLISEKGVITNDDLLTYSQTQKKIFPIQVQSIAISNFSCTSFSGKTFTLNKNSSHIGFRFGINLGYTF